jgi:tetratricopeptide (TPR) repeat protein
MFLRPLILSLLMAATAALAVAKEDPWVEVRSPHFIVVSNSNAKQASHVAAEFERMRAVFHSRFPKARVDAASPIIVIAVRDRKGFQALEPQAYLAKGQLNLAGLFLRTPEKNYVLLRLDAEGDHPYATIYHEYTHFIISHDQEWIPVWLNEGLAEYYQTTEIHDKNAELGRPSVENIMLLRQNRLLPLATLFAVDHNSPYYHEENKGSIFYAESWALTHYLQVKDSRDHNQRLTQYLNLVSNKQDPVTAAITAFGDLKQLEKDLANYVEQSSFSYSKFPVATGVDEAAYKVETLTEIQSEAVRADFLAYEQRVADSRTLLQHILHEDPDNISAYETMGYLAYREGNMQDAAEFYNHAVSLDSQSFLAHYFCATTAMMRQGISDSNSAQIEANLRTSTRLNPEFAPAFDQLALVRARLNHFDEAISLNLTAIQLEPENVAFRMNRANILLQMKRPNEAIALLQATAKMASDPQQLAMIYREQESIQQYMAATKRQEEQFRQSGTRIDDDAHSASDEPPAPDLPDDSRHGPKRTAIGTIKNVQCSAPALMRLKLQSTTKSLSLHARNYYKIDYSAVGFVPTGNMNPCKDLEAMKATVVYFEGDPASAEGQIISIEVRK